MARAVEVSMTLTWKPSPSYLPYLWMIPLLPLGACGVSGIINQELRQQESTVEAQAIDQALQHSDLLVQNLAAVAPQAGLPADRCEVLAGSTCQICYTEDAQGMSLKLSTPGCSLPAPKEGGDLDLKLNLASLALAARYGAEGVAVLSGVGRLDVSANLPVIGAYQAAATYQVEQGQVDQRTGAVQLVLVLTYQSGAGTPVPLRIVVNGTRTTISGTATGPNLSCALGGSLEAPTVTCASL